MDHSDQSLLTPREFARRAGIKPAQVQRLLRRGLLVGATKTVTRRWRIPAYAVQAYLTGERPRSAIAARTPYERLERLWLEFEGRPWPLADSALATTGAGTETSGNSPVSADGKKR